MSGNASKSNVARVRSGRLGGVPPQLAHQREVEAGLDALHVGEDHGRDIQVRIEGGTVRIERLYAVPELHGDGAGRRVRRRGSLVVAFTFPLFSRWASKPARKHPKNLNLDSTFQSVWAVIGGHSETRAATARRIVVRAGATERRREREWALERSERAYTTEGQGSRVRQIGLRGESSGHTSVELHERWAVLPRSAAAPPAAPRATCTERPAGVRAITPHAAAATRAATATGRTRSRGCRWRRKRTPSRLGSAS